MRTVFSFAHGLGGASGLSTPLKNGFTGEICCRFVSDLFFVLRGIFKEQVSIEELSTIVGQDGAADGSKTNESRGNFSYSTSMVNDLFNFTYSSEDIVGPVSLQMLLQAPSCFGQTSNASGRCLSCGISRPKHAAGVFFSSLTRAALSRKYHDISLLYRLYLRAERARQLNWSYKLS